MHRVSRLIRQRRRRRVMGSRGPTAAHIVLTFHVFPEDDHFVADCTELRVASFGETEHAALDAGIDAVQLYLTTLAANGELMQVFEERGVKIHPGPFPDAEDLAEVHVGIRPHESATRRVLEVPAGVGAGVG